MSIELSSYLQTFRLAVLVAAALILTAASISAQVTAGRLEVRVVDSAGAPFAGESVKAINEGTGHSRERTTLKSGVAFFANLEPGTYRIEVGSVTAPSIQISIAEKRIVTIVIGPSINQIQQPARIEPANEERTELVSALPNLNNDLTPLLQVVPGAVATGSLSLGKVVIDGKGKDQQVVRFDGIDATSMVDVPVGDSALDAVSSFSKPEVAFDIDNSTSKSKAFDSVFGPGTGTVTPGLTYAGRRAWSGEAYGIHRNDALNARNFFDYDGKNAIRRSRFGGKIGGHLDDAGDNLIYFAYDGVRGRTEQTLYEAVPIDASCACGSGPLASLMSGYLPRGTVVVPIASLNPDFLIAKRRGRSSVEANSFNIRVDSTRERKANASNDGRIDSFTFRLTRQTATNIVPDGVTGRQQRQHVLFNNLLVEWRHVSGPKTHDFKFGINETAPRVESEIPASTNPALSQSLIAISGAIQVSGLPDGRSTVPVATLGRLIKGAGRGFNLAPVSLSAAYDFVSSSPGKPEVQFGAEARSIHLAFDRLGGLTYTFPSLAAVRTGTTGSATFLSDLSAASPFTNGQGERHARQTYFLSYFQINSKPTKNATIKLGVRYDYFGRVGERDSRAVIVDPATGVILPATTPFYTSRKNNFQPRIALDYKIDPDRQIVVHAGAGIYSGVPKIGDLLIPIESDRFSTGITGAVYPTNSADIIKSYLDNPDTRQFQPLAFARNFKTPERAYKWEASLKIPFRKKTYALMPLYTGNIGRNLPLAGIANQITRVETNPDPTQPAIVVRQFDIIRSGQVFKPFGEFFFRTSDGHSSYNGFTLKVARIDKLSVIETLSAQYTLSRNVGNVSGAVASNPLSFASDLGYNAADIRHSFSLLESFNIYQALKHDHNHLGPLWRWRLASKLSASSGAPLIVRLDRPDVVYVDANGTVFSSPAAGRKAVLNVPGGGAAGATRTPNLISGVNPHVNSQLMILNPRAFAIPSPGTIGNMKRGQLRGHPSFQTDIALTYFLDDPSKETNKVSGEFKIEIFNLFNRANFGNPTASLPNALGTGLNQIQPSVPFTKDAAGSFGVVTAAGSSREMQFTLILRFNGGITK